MKKPTRDQEVHEGSLLSRRRSQDKDGRKEELKLINWDVLWLVAGGIAIGIALDKTGLAEALAHAIDYSVSTLYCSSALVNCLAK